MFSEEIFENRLASWAAFRNKLETVDNPVQFACNFYDEAKRHTLQCDPWDRNSWPDPWQLVEKNLYSEMCITLGICYSLQLTERFSGSSFEIHNTVDTKSKQTFYLLAVDNNIINPIIEEVYIGLPKHFVSQRIFKMPQVN